MKNRNISQIVGLIVIASLCVQITAANRQSFAKRVAGVGKRVYGKVAEKTKQAAQTAVTLSKQAVESGKQLLTKEQAIKRINQELDIVKAGVQAAEKKLRGQSLTDNDKKALALLAKHASILAALVVIATGMVGISAYLRLRKREATDIPPSMQTAEERAAATFWGGEWSEREKALFEAMQTPQPKPALPPKEAAIIHDIPGEELRTMPLPPAKRPLPPTLAGQIRAEKRLKTTTPPIPPREGTPSTSLQEEIRTGRQLRPVPPSAPQVKPTPFDPAMGMIERVRQQVPEEETSGADWD